MDPSQLSDGFIGYKPSGSTFNCSEAQVFVLGNGRLQRAGKTLGVDSGVEYTAIKDMSEGGITSGFNSEAGFLVWRNPAFYGGRARFCKTTNGDIYVTFMGSGGPPSCAAVYLTVYYAERCRNGIVVDTNELQSVYASAFHPSTPSMTPSEYPTVDGETHATGPIRPPGGAVPNNNENAGIPGQSHSVKATGDRSGSSVALIIGSGARTTDSQSQPTASTGVTSPNSPQESLTVSPSINMTTLPSLAGSGSQRTSNPASLPGSRDQSIPGGTSFTTNAPLPSAPGTATRPLTTIGFSAEEDEFNGIDFLDEFGGRYRPGHINPTASNPSGARGSSPTEKVSTSNASIAVLSGSNLIGTSALTPTLSASRGPGGGPRPIFAPVLPGHGDTTSSGASLPTGVLVAPGSYITTSSVPSAMQSIIVVSVHTAPTAAPPLPPSQLLSPSPSLRVGANSVTTSGSLSVPSPTRGSGSSPSNIATIIASVGPSPPSSSSLQLPSIASSLLAAFASGSSSAGLGTTLSTSPASATTDDDEADIIFLDADDPVSDITSNGHSGIAVAITSAAGTSQTLSSISATSVNNVASSVGTKSSTGISSDASSREPTSGKVSVPSQLPVASIAASLDTPVSLHSVSSANILSSSGSTITGGITGASLGHSIGTLSGAYVSVSANPASSSTSPVLPPISDPTAPSASSPAVATPLLAILPITIPTTVSTPIVQASSPPTPSSMASNIGSYMGSNIASSMAPAIVDSSDITIPAPAVTIHPLQSPPIISSPIQPATLGLLTTPLVSPSPSPIPQIDPTQVAADISPVIAQQPYPVAQQPYPVAQQPYPVAPQPYPVVPQRYPVAPQPYPVAAPVHSLPRNPERGEIHQDT
ncbi:hypothetical protein ANO14919_031200 [Xylariales sp. No.14919]|nr:hypothetical protein ANO14919_031200 [Xylariales sp. No.14919]